MPVNFYTTWQVDKLVEPEWSEYVLPSTDAKDFVDHQRLDFPKFIDFLADLQ